MRKLVRIRHALVLALVAAAVPVLQASATTAPASPAVAGQAAAANVVMPKVSPSSGWETPGFAADYSEIGERFSSAAVGDLDNNGVLDIVAGFPDGHIRAWRTDNGSRWFDFDTGPGAVQASPVLIDFNHDYRLDIVYANTHGDVGVVEANYRQPMRVNIGSGGPWSGAFGTPAVVDLDNDGSYEIVATSFNGYIYVITSWGTNYPGWPIYLTDSSWSSPAVGDIDGDGQVEIVAGYDCDGAPGQPCYPDYGGYVGAWEINGSKVGGVWPRFVSKQVAWSSPALADLDWDGRLDVVIGQGNMPFTMWDGGRQAMRGRYVYAFKGNGYDVGGWPVDVGRNVTSSPAIGDLNGDKRPDVAVVAEDGYVYAFNSVGQRMWARCVGNEQGAPPNGGSSGPGVCPVMHASPSIADIDNDGKQNVLVGGEQWVHAWDNAGNLMYSGETFAGTDPMTAVPTVVSVNGKTWIIEVATTSLGGKRGKVFAWTTNTALGRADWPNFKNSGLRTGSNATKVFLTYKNKYSEALYRIVSSGAARIPWEEWAQAGYPAPLPTNTEYVKYAWSPAVYAVTYWPRQWQWDWLNWQQYALAGQPSVRNAGWIAGSFVYKYVSSPVIWVQEPANIHHALTNAEWQAMGAPYPTMLG